MISWFGHIGALNKYVGANVAAVRGMALHEGKNVLLSPRHGSSSSRNVPPVYRAIATYIFTVSSEVKAAKRHSEIAFITVR